MISFLSIVAAPLIGLFAIKRWRNGLDDQSIYKDAEDFEGVGLTMLNSIGQHEPKKLFDGKKEFRTTWGFSVFTPVVLIAVCYMAPLVEVWESFGIKSMVVQCAILGVIAALFLHIWIWLTFFHRLSYDNTTISVVTDNFKKTSQRMADLDSIEIVQGRPLFILKFRTGANFKVSRAMSGVPKILSDLNKQIEMNRFLRSRTAG